MGISRLHMALLAVMSIFTGVIAPGTSTDISGLSYPMTDARIFTYLLLVFLIIGFYTASVHAWRMFRYNGIFIFGIIGILFFLTITGQVTETRTGADASGLSWGWIFLTIGSALLAYVYRDPTGGEAPSEIRQTVDTLLGIVGSFTLACIACVIILISLSFRDKSHQSSILESVIGSGNITNMSGVLLSRGYDEIPFFEYDRKDDILITSTRIKNEWETRIYHDGEMTTLSGTYRISEMIAGKIYSRDNQMRVYSGLTLVENMRAIDDGTVLLSRSGSDWTIRSKNKPTWSYDYSGSIDSPIISGDRATLAWIKKEDTGYQMIKMGKPIGQPYEKILEMHLSDGGYDLMAMVSQSGSSMIVKNGVPIWKIEPGYITGSYRSNGSHFIYTAKKDGATIIVYDGEILPQSYDEVREVFLEENGGYYAYFARPIGGIEYCLFTKYRGNICGLDGYMNPRLSADGSSVLYGGLKDGIWSIYRNTELLVRNTKYENTDISGDYLFFDITNPRTYLFVKKDPTTQKYTLIKNGKILPGVWDDFGTDVSFGYDNHILLKLKDHEGWKMAEI